METIPWVEKYRPQTLNDIVSQKDAIEIIKRYINSHELPHLLFHGPPGTGKTSAVLAISRLLYGDSSRASVLELNASDDRGINTVREQIKTFAESKSSFTSGHTHNEPSSNSNERPNSFKLVILDEADQMTSAAQNALRRIMEQYSENVRFCIICNYINKIHPAIQSRCTSFRFSPLFDTEIKSRVLEIAHSENIDLTDDGLSALLTVGKGDMRRILNCLQMSAMSNTGQTLNNDRILTTLGIATQKEVEWTFMQLMESPFHEAYKGLLTLVKTNGYSAQTFVSALYNHISTIDWPNTVIIQLIMRLADIEERLTIGSNEEIQLAALVSCFVNARYDLHKLTSTQS